jgi:diguanylate cyclase (GGDEF)-like protein
VDVDGGSNFVDLLPETAFGLALVAFGAVLGALGFSFLVGRHRARQLARLTDRLALATGASPAPERVAYPDRVLSESIERLAARIAEVETLASTDQLTRLTNRPACLQVLEVEVERANRYGRPLAVALIDIDHFKRVNDSYGHAVGDVVLRHVATLLHGNVRAVDTFGRYGGEEFLLVMPETDLEGGRSSAESLRRAIGRAALVVDVDGLPVEVTVTISVGVSGGDGSVPLDVDRLLREADGALYGAKSLGRDQAQVFRPLDEKAKVSSAQIDARARKRAARIGLAAFKASNLHLLDALSKRPGWAGGASALIANIASDVGRAVGLSDGDIDRIRTASLLHDLGKLAISDEILSKPAALDATEWQAMVQHPRIGQVVLEQAGAIRDAASIVLHHHEWFDGQGYPHGLAGQEIPIGSRIVAIADAYEAMISDRPYKAAVSHAEALNELRRHAGTQFDPELVAVFETLFGEDHPPVPPEAPTGAEKVRTKAR